MVDNEHAQLHHIAFAFPDSFMTVCAVAAVANGTTKITNIANQRVKECDRLAAMVSELRKVVGHSAIAAPFP